jgi:crotonobetainyl-CoA:carnitine CoA-transferase CaiB-like acyl-CoA transferase
MSPTPTGPLHGVRVLDLSSVVMGPLATQILGDLGADVITVEDPKGTLSRVMTAGPVPTLSGVALNLLRNKRNVVLDLKDADGLRAVLAIAATVDVVVTNLRPATLTRLGLAYEHVRAVREDIVYCQAQGYPSDSPAADAPAYDDVIQAGSGIPDTFRRQSGVPVLVPTLVADKVCGLTIAYAVLAALFERAQTGQGQHVEVPMIDVMTAFTLVEHAGPATTVPPLGPPGYPRILNPERQPQRTADGWINVLAYTRQNYEDLFTAAGRSDLARDERVHSARSRIAHADSLYADVAAVLTDRTTAEWLEFCADAGIPASAVPTLEELVEALPEDDHPRAGRYKVIPQPVRFSNHPGPTVHRHAAISGEHNDEVRAEVAAWQNDSDGPHAPTPRREEDL